MSHLEKIAKRKIFSESISLDSPPHPLNYIPQDSLCLPHPPINFKLQLNRNTPPNRKFLFFPDLGFDGEKIACGLGFKRPQPSSEERCWARMRFAVVLGIVTKHHPAGPSCFQSFARKEKRVSMDFGLLVVFVILVTG